MTPLTRRGFIQTTAAAMAASALPASAAEPELIDTNVSVGAWPFRHEVLGETTALVARLKSQGVTQAWTGHLDGLLHKDISSVNARLTDECKQHGGGLLMPVGSINPMLPGWEEDLRRCVAVHHMPAIRLHPNYHGYKLDAPVFEQLLDLAEKNRLLVQIALIMEEERTIHPLVNVPATDTAPLPSVLAKHPKARVQLLNAFRTLRGLPITTLATHGVAFEISMLEGVEGIAKLIQQIPAERICFGSHAPFFYFESAKLKLKESVLSTDQMAAVCAGNAKKLIATA